MNSRRATVGRWLTTLLLLVAWFGASNHCALGALQGAGAVHQHAGCCCHHSRIPDAPRNAPVKECCAALHSTLPTTEKSPAPPVTLDGDSQSVDLQPAGLSIRPETSKIEPIETGPPRAHSFAELVLQRSLRSHAPPLTA
jgi:hypothetical protein